MRLLPIQTAALAALLLAAGGPAPAQPPDLAALLPADAPASPAPDEVLRIVERRCVVCHGCYDAPCQLKLSAPEGLARGASKANVYDTGRLTEAQPTRLGVDATTVEGWRALGFHAVTGEDPDAAPLARMLALGRAAPFAPGAPLPEAVSLDRDRELTCATPEAFDAYAEAAPQGGMPYGMAALPEVEFATLGAWALSGAPLPARRFEIPPSIAGDVAAWEDFLNAPDPRMRLTSRYLYEHLFLAHLHFEGDAPDRFFRLVRSATPPDAPPQDIATRRPFDDPGKDFRYRLQPIAETILHKDHVVYEIGPKRIARLRELFLDPDWTAGPPPPYGPAGGDPFVTFAALPAEGRYRFLLDDALFFVRSFIRGPVCRGQVATDVIEDRFWVAFLAPEADLSVTDPDFLKNGAPLLSLPAAAAQGSAIAEILASPLDREDRWLRYRDSRYAASPAHAGGFALDAIWDGDGRDDEALLTVFRNYDNASVVTGFVGDTPETAWVIDYPIFERIHYDLVAGYDVFGDVAMQIRTRLYMDHLRREAEDLFLSFLPPDARRALHAEWYRGPLSELHAPWIDRPLLESGPTGVRFETSDPKRELLAALPGRAPGLWPTADPLNRCGGADCAGLDPVARALAGLTSREGPWVRYMPDLSLLRVAQADGGARVFTLFHDKAHTNVGLMVYETGRREPERDVVTAMEGQVGSYPNLFFEVAAADLSEFVARLRSVRGGGDWMALVRDHALRRTSAEFWRVSDALNDAMLRQDPLHGGLLDLGRYIDPGPDDPAD